MINDMHLENNNLSNNDREENLPEEQWINVNKNQMAGQISRPRPQAADQFLPRFFVFLFC